MITQEKFEKAIAILQTYFSKKIEPEAALAIWQEYLGDNLNDAELGQAVKEAIIQCRPHPSFMPTPKELVAFVNGGKEVQAIREWQDVLSAASGRKDAIAYLSVRGKVALSAIGGLHAIGAAEERVREKMEKNFIVVYCQCSDKDSRSLPMASPSQEPTQQDFVPMPEEIKAQMKDLFSKKGRGQEAEGRRKF
ncbi:hypothetical protein VF04_04465 [Nostoc linckia z7]|uniref:Uncharacterized protein n=2 Tax=Nostoc linckia TaxID=92942 RepID=A0A9Q5ZGD9_NOSLI|nr:hypothetical protein [Nostoc linckia]PHK42963.1 hypothetical protein VF12_01165 [Nostoc linckia z15]PHK48120.1 hypothetical protein VF13_02140 [Nostoc linckia z16]PHJ65040.1 hypothetical protein VF02_11950 [Nostoc linckia z1]PHJ70081.1 hypothetical protein VF05_11345 [Nostoc linckia z3]PHJ75119.1 hypothetical protein VF03_12270 [Nostoc linckia z2]